MRTNRRPGAETGAGPGAFGDSQAPVRLADVPLEALHNRGLSVASAGRRRSVRSNQASSGSGDLFASANSHSQLSTSGGSGSGGSASTSSTSQAFARPAVHPAPSRWGRLRRLRPGRRRRARQAPPARQPRQAPQGNAAAGARTPGQRAAQMALGWTAPLVVPERDRGNGSAGTGTTGAAANSPGTRPGRAGRGALAIEGVHSDRPDDSKRRLAWAVGLSATGEPRSELRRMDLRGVDRQTLDALETHQAELCKVPAGGELPRGDIYESQYAWHCHGGGPRGAANSFAPRGADGRAIFPVPPPAVVHAPTGVPLPRVFLPLAPPPAPPSSMDEALVRAVDDFAEVLDVASVDDIPQALARVATEGGELYTQRVMPLLERLKQLLRVAKARLPQEALWLWPFLKVGQQESPQQLNDVMAGSWPRGLLPPAFARSAAVGLRSHAAAAAAAGGGARPNPHEQRDDEDEVRAVRGACLRAMSLLPQRLGAASLQPPLESLPTADEEETRALQGWDLPPLADDPNADPVTRRAAGAQAAGTQLLTLWRLSGDLSVAACRVHAALMQHYAPGEEPPTHAEDGRALDPVERFWAMYELGLDRYVNQIVGVGARLAQGLPGPLVAQLAYNLQLRRTFKGLTGQEPDLREDASNGEPKAPVTTGEAAREWLTSETDTRIGEGKARVEGRLGPPPQPPKTKADQDAQAAAVAQLQYSQRKQEYDQALAEVERTAGRQAESALLQYLVRLGERARQAIDDFVALGVPTVRFSGHTDDVDTQAQRTAVQNALNNGQEPPSVDPMPNWALGPAATDPAAIARVLEHTERRRARAAVIQRVRYELDHPGQGVDGARAAAGAARAAEEGLCWGRGTRGRLAPPDGVSYSDFWLGPPGAQAEGLPGLPRGARRLTSGEQRELVKFFRDAGVDVTTHRWGWPDPRRLLESSANKLRGGLSRYEAARCHAAVLAATNVSLMLTMWFLRNNPWALGRQVLWQVGVRTIPSTLGIAARVSGGGRAAAVLRFMEVALWGAGFAYGATGTPALLGTGLMMVAAFAGHLLSDFEFVRKNQRHFDAVAYACGMLMGDWERLSVGLRGMLAGSKSVADRLFAQCGFNDNDLDCTFAAEGDSRNAGAFGWLSGWFSNERAQNSDPAWRATTHCTAAADGSSPAACKHDFQRANPSAPGERAPGASAFGDRPAHGLYGGVMSAVEARGLSAEQKRGAGMAAGRILGAAVQPPGDVPCDETAAWRATANSIARDGRNSGLFAKLGSLYQGAWHALGTATDAASAGVRVALSHGAAAASYASRLVFGADTGAAEASGLWQGTEPVLRGNPPATMASLGRSNTNQADLTVVFADGGTMPADAPLLYPTQAQARPPIVVSGAEARAGGSSDQGFSGLVARMAEGAAADTFAQPVSNYEGAGAALGAGPQTAVGTVARARVRQFCSALTNGTAMAPGGDPVGVAGYACDATPPSAASQSRLWGAFSAMTWLPGDGLNTVRKSWLGQVDAGLRGAVGAAFDAVVAAASAVGGGSAGGVPLAEGQAPNVLNPAPVAAGTCREPHRGIWGIPP